VIRVYDEAGNVIEKRLTIAANPALYEVRRRKDRRGVDLTESQLIRRLQNTSL
jgi:hypothetical protein